MELYFKQKPMMQLARSTLTRSLTRKQWVPLHHSWEGRNWRTITYDTKELAVVVTVTDEDGQLTAVAEYEGNQVFEKDYTPKAGGVVLNVREKCW